MNWNTNCIQALSDNNLFEDSGHRTRFKEFLDSYSDKPFFSKGLCKCMYLSAWDEEHFMILLRTLNDMCLGKDTDTQEMRFLGGALMDEQQNDESYIYLLSIAFLENSAFQMPEGVILSDRTSYVIRRALDAASVIDQVN